MQTPGEGELLVHSRSRHEAEVAVAPGQTLRWALRVGAHRLNVGVTLMYASEDGTFERSEPLHEMATLRPEDGVVGGTHTNDTDAHVGQPAEQRVVFTLDNTFSRTSAKVLAYKVWINSPQEALRDRNIAAALAGCSGDSSPPPPPPVALDLGVYPRVDAAEADWNALSARLRKDGWTVPGPEYDGKAAASLVGHRVFVHGRGEGRVLEYTYRKMRASSHEILFHDGVIDCEAATIYLASSAEGHKTMDGGFLPYLVDLNAVIRIRAEELKQALPDADDDTARPSAKKHAGPPWRVEDASTWCRLRNVRGEHVSAHSRTPQHLPPPAQPKLAQAGSDGDTAASTEDGSGAKAGTDDSGCIPEGECGISSDASAGSQHLYETFVMLGVGDLFKERHREGGQDQLGHCEPELLEVFPSCEDPERRESLRMFCCPDNFEVRSAQVSQGQIPQSPGYEQYIFRMTVSDDTTQLPSHYALNCGKQTNQEVGLPL
jgi:hypothetical protein